MGIAFNIIVLLTFSSNVMKFPKSMIWFRLYVYLKSKQRKLLINTLINDWFTRQLEKIIHLWKPDELRGKLTIFLFGRKLSITLNNEPELIFLVFPSGPCSLFPWWMKQHPENQVIASSDSTNKNVFTIF